MKIVEEEVKTTVKKYIAIDGTVFTTPEACLDYEKTIKEVKRKCDKCNGYGRVRGRWVDEYDNYDIGHIEAHYEWDTCPKCNGYGYTVKYKKIK